jgi:hypothetical protein
LSSDKANWLPTVGKHHAREFPLSVMLNSHLIESRYHCSINPQRPFSCHVHPVTVVSGKQRRSPPSTPNEVKPLDTRQGEIRRSAGHCILGVGCLPLMELLGPSMCNVPQYSSTLLIFPAVL